MDRLLTLGERKTVPLTTYKKGGHIDLKIFPI